MLERELRVLFALPWVANSHFPKLWLPSLTPTLWVIVEGLWLLFSHEKSEGLHQKRATCTVTLHIGFGPILLFPGDILSLCLTIVN